ncbi:MAG: hypothetical protein M3N33_13475 [Actinomycetota bacterium]|nr:hypothetical protein [Actinomycetota bacterium]
MTDPSFDTETGSADLVLKSVGSLVPVGKLDDRIRGATVVGVRLGDVIDDPARGDDATFDGSLGVPEAQANADEEGADKNQDQIRRPPMKPSHQPQHRVGPRTSAPTARDQLPGATVHRIRDAMKERVAALA